MSKNVKFSKLMQNTFIVGTGFFLAKVLPSLPQLVLFSVLHCAAVLITLLIYLALLLAIIVSR